LKKIAEIHKYDIYNKPDLVLFVNYLQLKLTQRIKTCGQPYDPIFLAFAKNMAIFDPSLLYFSPQNCQ
jgi:hypothetical protein